MTTAMKICNLILFVAMIAVNALANLLPLGGSTTGGVSAKYPNLFTPAGITFAIWGVIYLFMGFFVFCQLDIVKKVTIPTGLSQAVGILFLISCVLNIGWIFAWHYDQIELSMVLMLLLLISLILINLRIGTVSELNIPGRLIIIGFNIYLGWITAATIANASVLLVKTGWRGGTLCEVFWTVAVLAIGTILGILFAVFGHRYAATLTLVWAFLGILIKHLSMSGHHGRYPVIIFSTSISLILMIVVPVLTAIIGAQRN